MGRPADPAKTGFEFKGWFKEADCRNEWKFDTDTVEGDITLYAKWEEKKDDGPGQNPVYTVTFNANGGYGGGSLATGAGYRHRLPTEYHRLCPLGLESQHAVRQLLSNLYVQRHLRRKPVPGPQLCRPGRYRHRNVQPLEQLRAGPGFSLPA